MVDWAIVSPIITGLIAVLGSLVGVTKILARNSKKNRDDPKNFENGEKLANYFAEVKKDNSEIKSILNEIIRTLDRIEEKIS